MVHGQRQGLQRSRSIAFDRVRKSSTAELEQKKLVEAAPECFYQEPKVS
jgi:hypothetical protein